MSVSESLMMNNENAVANAAQVFNAEAGQVKFSKDTESVDVKAEQKLIGLTKEQLERYRNDPVWKPIRYTLFALFWLVWVGMFAGAILIVVLSPKCAAKKDSQWHQKTVAYQIFTPTFRDSDADGVGDFLGIKEKLNELRRIGVSTIWPTPLLKTLKDDFNPASVVDFNSVDPRFGTEEDLKNLIEEAHDLGLYFIADLPLTVASTNPQASSGIGNDKVRLLDIGKPLVRDMLKKVAGHLIEYGVDGIHFAQYGLKYPLRNSIDNLDILATEIRREFSPLFHDGNESFLIIADTPSLRSSGSINLYTRALFRYPNATNAICDSVNLFTCFEQSVNTGAGEIAMNKSSLPFWQIGDVSHAKPIFRAGSPAEDSAASVALTALQLFLPGSVGIYYGEELGLPSVSGNLSQFGLMSWDSDNTLGFSSISGDNFFNKLSEDQSKTLNFKSQYDQTHSPLRSFQKIAQLRARDEVFQDGIINTATVDGVRVFSRVLAGNDKAYLLVVNWPTENDKTTKQFAVDSTILQGHQVTRAELLLEQPHSTVNPSAIELDKTKLTLEPYQYVLLRLVVA